MSMEYIRQCRNRHMQADKQAWLDAGNACAGAHTAYRQQQQVAQEERAWAGPAGHKDDRACAVASCTQTTAHMNALNLPEVTVETFVRWVFYTSILYMLLMQSPVRRTGVTSNSTSPKCMINKCSVEMTEYPIHIRVRAHRHACMEFKVYLKARVFFLRWGG